MMGDNAIRQNARQSDDIDTSVRLDLSQRSESPRVQELYLHRKLREEIERKSSTRMRYVDSELHFRNKEFNRISEGNNNINNNNQLGAQQPTSRISVGSTKRPTCIEQQDLRFDYISDNNSTDPSAQLNTSNCPVCFIKELKQSMLNTNRILQESNKQLSKLKADGLKTYFQKQMTE